MNGQELHLLFNHVPVIGSVGALLVLVLAWVWPTKEMTRTALVVTALVGVSAVLAFVTGEPAEEVVEGLPGITRNAIHEHEEAADRALWVGIAAGVAALATLFVGRRRPSRRSALLPSLVLTVVLVAAMAWTAHLGGMVHRPELRGGAAVAPGGEVGDHD